MPILNIILCFLGIYKNASLRGIILYALKTYIERRFVMFMAFEAVVPIVLTKVGASVFNAIAAVVISSIIYKLIKGIKI